MNKKKYIQDMTFVASTPFLFIGMVVGIIYKLLVYGFTTGVGVCDSFMNLPLYEIDKEDK